MIAHCIDVLHRKSAKCFRDNSVGCLIIVVVIKFNIRKFSHHCLLQQLLSNFDQNHLLFAQFSYLMFWQTVLCNVDRGGGRNMILQKSGNMDVVSKTNSAARADSHSVACRPASEEEGDCLSLPATHQIDRWAFPNISGTSWGHLRDHLRAFRNFPLQGERR